MPNWSQLETIPHFVPRRITPRGRPMLLLKLAGTHTEIGRQRGHALGEDMRQFQDWLRHFILRVMEFPESKLDALATRLEKNLVHNAPWMLEEIHGMSEASDVPVRNILHANFYALIGDAMGNWCSSVAVRQSDQGPLLGQNLDIGPEDFHYVEEWRPTVRGARAVLRHMKVTMCRHECGINDAGLAVASSNLPASMQHEKPWDWNGTHFHFLPTFVLRNCASVAEAIEYLRGLPPTIPSSAGYQLNLLDASGNMAVVDKTNDRTVVRQCEPDLNFTSNCTLDDEFERWLLGAPNPDGRARVARVLREWKQLNGSRPTRKWLETLMRTDSGDGCLCRWSKSGYSRLGFIFSPTAGTMDISNGPPSQVTYERCTFTEEPGRMSS